ncbi:Thyroid adenoma-associated -like protein [Trichinella patagoniensis]|uniref:Thyroid adenoma-associated-like protein n=1 Tax=Trichinella patagoniensis TaxID=990121 RepID=A0A0V0ZN14_9BILA|nr:Thyroid adenoma-associated -like protein [Trichinella patagoniensis]
MEGEVSAYFSEELVAVLPEQLKANLRSVVSKIKADAITDAKKQHEWTFVGGNCKEVQKLKTLLDESLANVARLEAEKNRCMIKQWQKYDSCQKLEEKLAAVTERFEQERVQANNLEKANAELIELIDDKEMKIEDLENEVAALAKSCDEQFGINVGLRKMNDDSSLKIQILENKEKLMEDQIAEMMVRNEKPIVELRKTFHDHLTASAKKEYELREMLASTENMVAHLKAVCMRYEEERKILQEGKDDIAIQLSRERAQAESLKNAMTELEEKFQQTNESLAKYETVAGSLSDEVEHLTFQYSQKVEEKNSQIKTLQQEHEKQNQLNENEIQALKAQLNGMRQKAKMRDSRSGQMCGVGLAQQKSNLLDGLGNGVESYENEKLNDLLYTLAQEQKTMVSTWKQWKDEAKKLRSDMETISKEKNCLIEENRQLVENNLLYIQKLNDMVRKLDENGLLTEQLNDEMKLLLEKARREVDKMRENQHRLRRLRSEDEFSDSEERLSGIGELFEREMEDGIDEVNIANSAPSFSSSSQLLQVANSAAFTNVPDNSTNMRSGIVVDEDSSPVVMLTNETKGKSESDKESFGLLLNRLREENFALLARNSELETLLKHEEERFQLLNINLEAEKAAFANKQQDCQKMIITLAEQNKLIEEMKWKLNCVGNASALEADLRDTHKWMSEMMSSVKQALGKFEMANIADNLGNLQKKMEAELQKVVDKAVLPVKEENRTLIEARMKMVQFLDKMTKLHSSVRENFEKDNASVEARLHACLEEKDKLQQDVERCRKEKEALNCRTIRAEEELEVLRMRFDVFGGEVDSRWFEAVFRNKHLANANGPTSRGNDHQEVLLSVDELQRYKTLCEQLHQTIIQPSVTDSQRQCERSVDEELNRWRSEVDDLNEKLRSMKSKIENLVESVQERDVRICELQLRLDACLSEKDNCMKQLEKWQTEAAALSVENGQWKQELDNLKLCMENVSSECLASVKTDTETLFVKIRESLPIGEDEQRQEEKKHNKQKGKWKQPQQQQQVVELEREEEYVVDSDVENDNRDSRNDYDDDDDEMTGDIMNIDVDDDLNGGNNENDDDDDLDADIDDDEDGDEDDDDDEDEFDDELDDMVRYLDDNGRKWYEQQIYMKELHVRLANTERALQEASQTLLAVQNGTDVLAEVERAEVETPELLQNLRWERQKLEEKLAVAEEEALRYRTKAQLFEDSLRNVTEALEEREQQNALVDALRQERSELMFRLNVLKEYEEENALLKDELQNLQLVVAQGPDAFRSVSVDFQERLANYKRRCIANEKRLSSVEQQLAELKSRASTLLAVLDQSSPVDQRRSVDSPTQPGEDSIQNGRGSTLPTPTRQPSPPAHHLNLGESETGSASVSSTNNNAPATATASSLQDVIVGSSDVRVSSSRGSLQSAETLAGLAKKKLTTGRRRHAAAMEMAPTAKRVCCRESLVQDPQVVGSSSVDQQHHRHSTGELVLTTFAEGEPESTELNVSYLEETPEGDDDDEALSLVWPEDVDAAFDDYEPTTVDANGRGDQPQPSGQAVECGDETEPVLGFDTVEESSSSLCWSSVSASAASTSFALPGYNIQSSSAAVGSGERSVFCLRVKMVIHCPEGNSFSIAEIRAQLNLGRRSVWLQSCCANHDFRMRDVLLPFCILSPLKSKRAEEVASKLLEIFLTFGAPSILQSDNGREFLHCICITEKCPRRHLLFIGFIEQLLNILNLAVVPLGKEHQIGIFQLIWHFWDHADEQLTSRYFSLFRSLLKIHGRNCFLNFSNEDPVTSAQLVDPMDSCPQKDCLFLKMIFDMFLSAVGTVPYVYKYLTSLLRFSGIGMDRKRLDLLWNKIMDDMSKNNTYAVHFYVALAEADVRVSKNWCHFWIGKLLHHVNKNYDDAASWHRIFTKVLPKLFKLRDYSNCCEAVKHQIANHFAVEHLADHCAILNLCLVKHELSFRLSGMYSEYFPYHLLNRTLLCGNTMIVGEAFGILIDNIEFGSVWIHLLPTAMESAGFFALYASKSDRQSMLARLKNLLIRIRSMVNEVRREDSEEEHCRDLEILSNTVKDLFDLSIYVLTHCIQYSSRHFALEMLKILVDLSFFQLPPAAGDDDSVWKRFQLEWDGEPSVVLFDCLVDRFEENRNLALELFRTVPYEIRVQFKLRDNVQWMDFLSSNKILHGDVAMTLLEFSFFQNSVSALEDKDRIYEQFLILARSDLTQFNGGSRTILVEVCKGGVHIAQLLLPVVSNKSRLGEDFNALSSSSCNDSMQEERVSVWRYFKQLSEFLALISEMLLEDGDFSPEVEDDSSLIRIICFYFRTLVFSCLHCGVLETSSDPFRRFCHALRRSECYSTYPLHWIDEIMAEFQNDQLSSNISRKSAGLPYLISGCLSSLASDSVEEGITVLDFVMNLLHEKCIDSDSLTTTKIHCCNVMRLLIREAQFREACRSHLRIGMITAFYAMRDQDWSVRNSANYLFSVLLTRIFGPPKQRSLTTSDNYDSDATVTSKQSDFHFFSTFYGLDDIMLELLEQCLLGSWNQSSISSAFSVLTVLTHLYPFRSHYYRSDSSNSSSCSCDARLNYLLKFWSPVFRILLTCPVMHLRQLAASALVSTLPHDNLLALIETSRQFITSIRTSSQNAINGFLQLVYVAYNKYSNDETLSKVISCAFRENKEFLDLDLVRKNCYENISILLTLLCDGSMPIESSLRNIFFGLRDLVAQSPTGCSLRRTFVRWAVTERNNMEIAWPIITEDENFRIELWTVVEKCPDLEVIFDLKKMNMMINDLMNTTSEALIHKTVSVLYKRYVLLHEVKRVTKELFWISFSRRYDAMRSLRSRSCLFLFACIYLPCTTQSRWANNIMGKLIEHLLKECCEGDEVVVDEFLFDALTVFFQRRDQMKLKCAKPWLILLYILLLSTDSDSRHRAAELCHILQDEGRACSEFLPALHLKSIGEVSAAEYIIDLIEKLDKPLLQRLVRTILSSFCRIIRDRVESDIAMHSSFYKDDLNKLFEPVWALNSVMRSYNTDVNCNEYPVLPLYHCVLFQQNSILWPPSEDEREPSAVGYEYANILKACSQLMESRGRRLALNDQFISIIMKSLKRVSLPWEVLDTELTIQNTNTIDTVALGKSRPKWQAQSVIHFCFLCFSYFFYFKYLHSGLLQKNHNKMEGTVYVVFYRKSILLHQY